MWIFKSLPFYDRIAFLGEYPYNIITSMVVILLAFWGFKYMLYALRFKEIERRITAYPNLAEARVHMADLMQENGFYADAANYLNQAIALHPDLHYARLKLAEVCFILGDRANAVAQLREVAKRTSEDKILFLVQSMLRVNAIAKEEVFS